MAQKKGSGGVKALAVSPLVDELTQGGTEPPAVSVLVGYVGRSAEEGRVRLYLTPDLSSYVEFSEDDLVRSEPQGEGGAGATNVWVRRGAKLTHTQTFSREVQAEFLSGGIADAFGGAFGAASQSIITNNTANLMAITGNNTGNAPAAFGGEMNALTVTPATPTLPYTPVVTGIITRITQVGCTAFCGITRKPMCT